MAEREFTGILRNTWQKPLHCQDSGLRIGGGVFVRDLLRPETKHIDPGQQGDWKSESDGARRPRLMGESYARSPGRRWSRH